MNENRPIQKFSVGLVTAAVWENEGKEGRIFKSVTLQKRYKDGKEWKTTNSLNANDLPKAVLALNKAFEFISLRQDSGEKEFLSAEF